MIRALTAATLVVAGVVVSTATASADGPVKYAVAGDSLSANAGQWLAQESDPSVQYVGGFQKAGATTYSVNNAIGPVPDADVLVVMLGTNDVRYGVPLATLDAQIESIVQKVGAPHVLLTYLPPCNITADTVSGSVVDDQNKHIVYSRDLVSLAERHGWLIADPFAPWRTYAGAYSGIGASTDGVHPTAAVAGQVADRMALYIRQAGLAG